MPRRTVSHRFYRRFVPTAGLRGPVSLAPASLILGVMAWALAGCGSSQSNSGTAGPSAGRPTDATTKAMRVDTITPNTGVTTGGTRVTIRGGPFQNDAAVLFGLDAGLQVEIVNNQVVTAATPAHAPGTVNVTVVSNGNSDTLIGGFTYFEPPAIQIDSITPNAGLTEGGTRVTVRGEAFGPDTALLFGETAATEVKVYNARLLTAITPPHPAGQVDVTALTAGASFTLALGFDYQEPLPPEVRVTQVIPDSGPTAGGTRVTIRGQKFSSDAAVLFDEFAGEQVHFFNETLLSALTPAHPRGRVGVTVMAGGAQDTLADSFEYQAPVLTIDSVTPDQGFVIGGTNVTLRGDGFTEGTAVLFGDFASEHVNFFNAKLITASVPPAFEAGVVDIIVITGEDAFTLTGGYEYVEVPVPTPAITSISPVFGPIEGGTEVTIRGRDFAPDTGVLFGDNAASDVQVINEQLIIAVAPEAMAPGLVDITLVYADKDIVERDAFNYILPGTDDGTDTDGDGLTDFQESSGWEIWIDFFGMGLGFDTFGNVTRFTVVSDPGSTDGDGDGLSDQEEFLNRSNPGNPDSDGDGLRDGEEVHRWFTLPTTTDSDADSRGPNLNITPVPALFDGFELFDLAVLNLAENNTNRVVRARGTSPTLDDTDGDGRTDFEEIDTPARNGYLADLPQLIIEPVGEVGVRLDVEYAESEGETEEYGTTFSESTTTSLAVQQSATLGFSVQQSATLGVEGGISIDVLKGTGTATATYGLSAEYTTASSAEQAVTKGKESSRAEGHSFERTESFSTGSMQAAFKLTNPGNIAYTLRNFSLLATQPNKERTLRGYIQGDSFVPIGTLLPAVDSFTLAPGESTQPIGLSASGLNGDVVREFLQHGNTLGFKSFSLDFETADGLNFDFIQEFTRAQTALVIIDFGDGEIRRYHVATNVDRKPDASFAGITMRAFLQGVLGLVRGDAQRGYTVGGLFTGNPYTDLHSLLGRRFRSSGGGKDYWIVRGTSEARHTHRNFEDIILKAGDELWLMFNRDSDNDGLSDPVETAYGTLEDPVATDDADGDGLTDYEEFLGWIVFEDPDNPFDPNNLPPEGSVNGEGFKYFRTDSNPVAADYDDDGLTDLQEWQVRSDPRHPDTDRDGLIDGRDPFPTRQARLLCVNAAATGSPQPCSGYTPECCWQQPYKRLQDALEAYRAGAATPNNPADDVAEIWVAQGIYHPDASSSSPNGSNDRFATFTMGNNMGMYGGFVGPRPRLDRPGTLPGETKRGQRNADPLANGTVLSGDLANDDTGPIDLNTVSQRTDNSQRIVYAPSGANASAVLDGFLITGAMALDPLFGREDVRGRDCSDAEAITGTGLFPFQTDDGAGQADPGGCLFAKDKYFRWRATRSGTAMASTCGRTSLDTVIAVYAIGGALPCGENINDTLLACNDDVCSAQSSVSFAAGAGSEYLIRIGVYPDTPGGSAQFIIAYPDSSPLELFSSGGGLHIDNASPTVRNVLFLANGSREFGAGARIDSGGPTFEHCVFAENVAAMGAGAGVMNPNRARFTACSFEQNDVVQYDPDNANGGGLYVVSTAGQARSLTLEGCGFVGNEAFNRGGGMYAKETNAQLLISVDGCRFVSNRISRTSGCDDQPGGPDNRQGSGGGIFALSHMSITNCMFWDNRSCGIGGAIFVRRPISVINSTLAYNRCINSNEGAGISAWKQGAVATVENSILWFNQMGLPDPGGNPLEADEPSERLQLAKEDDGILTVRNSCFNQPSQHNANGNFGDDPQLTNFASGNLQLSAMSPCIDRGNSFVDVMPFVPGVQLLPELDLFGSPRVVDGNGDGIETVDIGAFESPGSD